MRGREKCHFKQMMWRGDCNSDLVQKQFVKNAEWSLLCQHNNFLFFFWSKSQILWFRVANKSRSTYKFFMRFLISNCAYGKIWIMPKIWVKSCCILLPISFVLSPRTVSNSHLIQTNWRRSFAVRSIYNLLSTSSTTKSLRSDSVYILGLWRVTYSFIAPVF